MGNLPKNRVNQSQVFAHISLDFFGPIQMKASFTRGTKNMKCYGGVFMCMCTKALHVELITTLSAEGFIAALKRFMARRGVVTSITCDNGTNFVGGNTLLKKDLEEFIQTLRDKNIQEDIVEFCAGLKIQFKFSPPRVAHMNGLIESSVKLFKTHLLKVLGNRTLNYEQLLTLLVITEGILNSRPLIQVMSDDHDCEIISPGLFLIGRAMNMLPEPNILEKNVVKHWELVQQQAQKFWEIWSKSYLHELQTRKKWRTVENNVKVGQIAILESDLMPKSCWNMVKIVQVFPDQDGVVRVVAFQRGNKIEKRHVCKLAMLEVYSKTATMVNNTATEEADELQPLIMPPPATPTARLSKVQAAKRNKREDTPDPRSPMANQKKREDTPDPRSPRTDRSPITRQQIRKRDDTPDPRSPSRNTKGQHKCQPKKVSLMPWKTPEPRRSKRIQERDRKRSGCSKLLVGSLLLMLFIIAVTANPNIDEEYQGNIYEEHQGMAEYEDYTERDQSDELITVEKRWRPRFGLGRFRPKPKPNMISPNIDKVRSKVSPATKEIIKDGAKIASEREAAESESNRAKIAFAKDTSGTESPSPHKTGKDVTPIKTQIHQTPSNNNIDLNLHNKMGGVSRVKDAWDLGAIGEKKDNSLMSSIGEAIQTDSNLRGLANSTLTFAKERINNKTFHESSTQETTPMDEVMAPIRSTRETFQEDEPDVNMTELVTNILNESLIVVDLGSIWLESEPMTLVFNTKVNASLEVERMQHVLSKMQRECGRIFVLAKPPCNERSNIGIGIQRKVLDIVESMEMAPTNMEFAEFELPEISYELEELAGRIDNASKAMDQAVRELDHRYKHTTVTITTGNTYASKIHNSGLETLREIKRELELIEQQLVFNGPIEKQLQKLFKSARRGRKFLIETLTDWPAQLVKQPNGLIVVKIELPMVQEDPYQLMKVFALPGEDHSILKIPVDTLAINRELKRFFYIPKEIKVKHFPGDTHVAKILRTHKLSRTATDCITGLLQKEYMETCERKPLHTPFHIFEQISSDEFLFFSTTFVAGSLICQKREWPIEGRRGMLRVPKNCEIETELDVLIGARAESANQANISVITIHRKSFENKNLNISNQTNNVNKKYLEALEKPEKMTEDETNNTTILSSISEDNSETNETAESLQSNVLLGYENNGTAELESENYSETLNEIPASKFILNVAVNTTQSSVSVAVNATQSFSKDTTEELIRATTSLRAETGSLPDREKERKVKTNNETIRSTLSTASSIFVLPNKVATSKVIPFIKEKAVDAKNKGKVITGKAKNWITNVMFYAQIVSAAILSTIVLILLYCIGKRIQATRQATEIYPIPQVVYYDHYQVTKAINAEANLIGENEKRSSLKRKINGQKKSVSFLESVV